MRRRRESRFSSRIEAAPGRVFGWHASPGAFRRLCPPWETVRILDPGQGLKNGSRAILRVGPGPFALRWVAEHRDCIEGHQFRDVQVAGPFARWEHLHRMIAAGPSATLLEDRIRWTPPGGFLGALLLGRTIERRIERMFTFRHRRTREDIAALANERDGGRRILVSGSSGLAGSALVPFLESGGHHVTRLVRSGRRDGSSILWDPASGIREPERLEGLDAVVHLAGESIMGRWTARKKERIRDSRVIGTRILCEALSRLDRPPRVVAVASAIGFYGDRGDEELDEGTSRGSGFLAEVCREWEQATLPAVDAGIRVVNLRFGVILSPEGGALSRMLTPFRLGLGGRVGSGKQVMSWISIDDAVGSIHHAIRTESLEGPVNVVSPEPVTSAELTATLARVLRRPALVPLPAAMARLAFGEMADALLLSSARVLPGKLRCSGYRFRQPDLEDTLRHLLGRTEDGVSRLEFTGRAGSLSFHDRDGK